MNWTEEQEKRQAVIMQNGNEGTHYDDPAYLEMMYQEEQERMNNHYFDSFELDMDIDL